MGKKPQTDACVEWAHKVYNNSTLKTEMLHHRKMFQGQVRKQEKQQILLDSHIESKGNQSDSQNCGPKFFVTALFFTSILDIILCGRWNR